MSKQIPFRYDFVGSFLRPANLKAAREGFENGKISAYELKAVEDKEIERLINKQKRIRLSRHYGRRIQTCDMALGFYVGDLTVWHMKKRKQVYRFTAKTQ